MVAMMNCNGTLTKGGETKVISFMFLICVIQLKAREKCKGVRNDIDIIRAQQSMTTFSAGTNLGIWMVVISSTLNNRRGNSEGKFPVPCQYGDTVHQSQ